LVKIQNDNEKAQRVQLEKGALLEQRKVIQSQMRAEKDELMRKFEMIQKTGKIPPELADKIGKDRLESLQNTNIDSSHNNNTNNNNNTNSPPFKSPNNTLVKPKREQKSQPETIIEESYKDQKEQSQPEQNNNPEQLQKQKQNNEIIKQNEK